MHELSIAVGLVEAACEEVARLEGSPEVRALRLRLGPLSGVVEEALRFSFEIAAGGTAVSGARLDVERTAVRGWCDRCRAERAIAGVRLVCPACGRGIAEVRAGRELELVALEIEGPPEEVP